MMAYGEQVGFVGLGGMGRGLVKNLLKHGVAVTVHDLDEAAIGHAVSLGAGRATSLDELAARSGRSPILRNEFSENPD